MNVPLDNLYNWIEGLLPCPAIMYVFYPHGSKKISDLHMMRSYDPESLWKLPAVIANDQEPLNWEYYNDSNLYKNTLGWHHLPQDLRDVATKFYSDYNLKSRIYGRSSWIYDKSIIVHSEKNSKDVDQYQNNGFICLHYWAHALIARDWYRFAQHDVRLDTSQKNTNTFLIYCRDWSEGREYRLKFLELLVTHGLESVSHTSFMHYNSNGNHFSNYKFSNRNFEFLNPKTIDNISNNKVASSSSADYDWRDFVLTKLSIILETVFDGTKIHLTEKTLRPIACGHPFILAAGPGSLDYIKSYGFRTFSPYIDESYDQETDSLKRLEKIITSMKKIQDLQGKDLDDFNHNTKIIALYNKQHFFSDKFFSQIKNELKTNLEAAMPQMNEFLGKTYLQYCKTLRINNMLHMSSGRAKLIPYIRQLRQSYPKSRSSHGEDSQV